MTNFAKVKDHNGLVRELYSKAILSVDQTSLQDHRAKKKMLKEMFDHTEKINNLEKELSEIKNLLYSLLQNNKAE